MRCISLWQPWGSLWLSGVKIHETRHWHIQRQWKDWKPGDRIAVHASQRFIKDHDTEFAGILRRQFGNNWFRELPTGALIGTIAVTACVGTDDISPSFYPNMAACADDRECGDFYPGRFAWRGAAPEIFTQPILYRGAQGIFNVDDAILPSRWAA